MNRNNKHSWLHEFNDFLKGSDQVPPVEVSRRVLSRIQSELNPSLKLVFIKVLTIQTFIAFIMLLFCPQLGVGPIFAEAVIMDFFMAFGDLVCASACGAIFLGGGLLVSSCLLRKEELAVANRFRLRAVLLLVSLSFSGLMLVGGEADEWSYIFWIGGAIVGAWITMFLSAKIRLRHESLFTLLAVPRKIV